jgi:hypothetical protein
MLSGKFWEMTCGLNPSQCPEIYRQLPLAHSQAKFVHVFVQCRISILNQTIFLNKSLIKSITYLYLSKILKRREKQFQFFVCYFSTSYLD